MCVIVNLLDSCDWSQLGPSWWHWVTLRHSPLPALSLIQPSISNNIDDPGSPSPPSEGLSRQSTRPPPTQPYICPVQGLLLSVIVLCWSQTYLSTLVWEQQIIVLSRLSSAWSVFSGVFTLIVLHWGLTTRLWLCTRKVGLRTASDRIYVAWCAQRCKTFPTLPNAAI